MYDKINLFLPTYKRVNNGRLPKLLNSIIELAEDTNNVVITFLVNWDDNETLDYISENQEWFPCESCRLITELKKPNLSVFYNYIYDNTFFNNDNYIISMLGDDMYFRTKGYDTRIIEEINKRDGKCVVWCNDNYIGRDRCCVNLFTTRAFVEATKKPFMCEAFSADYIDVVWFRIQQKLNCGVYLKDVILEHGHNRRLPKEQWDETRNRLVEQIHASRKNENSIDYYVDAVVKKVIESGFITIDKTS